MTDFTIHTIETTPEGSVDELKKAEQAFGLVPNLLGIMSESPEALVSYRTLHDNFSSSSLTAEEKTVVWLTVSTYNECHYCVPAHTAIAHGMKVDGAIIEALRDNTALGNEKLEILRQFTISIVENRGRVSEEEVQNFLSAGFTKQQIFEVLVGVTQKTLSNYVNHIVDTPVDEPFTPFAWSK